KSRCRLEREHRLSPRHRCRPRDRRRLRLVGAAARGPRVCLLSPLSFPRHAEARPGVRLIPARTKGRGRQLCAGLSLCPHPRSLWLEALSGDLPDLGSDLLRAERTVDGVPAAQTFASGAEAGTDAVMKITGLLMEGVVLTLLAGKACTGRKVEEEREIGLDAMGRESVERTDRGKVEAAAVALVSDGRIGEAVADDDGRTF